MGRKGSKLVIEWVVGQEVVGLPQFACMWQTILE